ncbi:outer membrane lipoprotein-sorting protein [Sedimentitalea sp. XS_ASV28]|uniref:outer membrane lipoprotein-sorting protein n=1 Tax=Sedimentitalea sp. XS_ASV28 TaxID=3241296 RepID=UPI003519AB1B
MTAQRSFRALAAIAVLSAVALLANPGARANAQAAPSVTEMVNRANLASYFQGNDGRVRVSMTITDSQKRTRTREMTILRVDGPRTDSLAGRAYLGPQKYYVYFTRPADVNKMAFLVWKQQNRDDDRWLYLPALDLVKRIAAADKRTSFVGSDFFYEDVSGRNIDFDTHELKEVTANFYVLRNTPKRPGSVEFAYYDMYLHKGTFLPVRVEYFDRRGRKYRVYDALEVKTIQGRPTVVKARMSNLNTGSSTVVTYRNVRYDVGLPDGIFSERYLRRAPTEYLR